MKLIAIIFALSMSAFAQDPTWINGALVPGSAPCVGTNSQGQLIPATCSGTGGGITQLTGDILAGPGAGSVGATLPNVNTGPGLCGDSTHVCQVTTNGKGLVTVQSPVSISGGGSSGGVLAVPAAAAAVGYVNQTFFSGMKESDFDQGQTYLPGFPWYYNRFFSGTPAPPESITFHENYATFNGVTRTVQVATGGLSKTTAPKDFTGIAFGGGFYAEASISFSLADKFANPSVAWPSFWAMSVEHFVQDTTLDQWPGQIPGYEHWIEMDAFEVDQLNFAYGATIHDWFGKNATAPCVPSYCGVSNTPSTGLSSYVNNQVRARKSYTDYAAYHRAGMLWVPATSLNDKVGGAIAYVSGGTAAVKANGACFVTAVGGGGTGAAGYITVLNPSVITGNIVLTNLGAGYTSVPTSWTLTGGYSSIPARPYGFSPYSSLSDCSGTITTSGGDLVSGYWAAYFDGVQQNIVGWQLYTGTGGQDPPSGTAPWTFGVADVTHQLIVLDTGVGLPMDIRYVSVWQLDGSQNIVHN